MDFPGMPSVPTIAAASIMLALASSAALGQSLRDLRALFDEQVGADTIANLLDDLARECEHEQRQRDHRDPEQGPQRFAVFRQQCEGA